MSGLDKLLLPDEKIVFHTKKSLIIFLYPVLWTLITAYFIYQKTAFMPYAQGLPLLKSLPSFAWVPGLIALGSWLNRGMTYLTSNFWVTNRRVIMREGFFSRHATETRLTAIAEIRVDQSLVGQALDFGSVSINSFGGGSEAFDLISAPYSFQRYTSQSVDQPAK